MALTIDELGLMLSQPVPRDLPKELRDELKKPALLLGIGGGCLASLFFFPVSLALPFLIWRAYKKHLALLAEGDFVMARVIHVRESDRSLSLLVEDATGNEQKIFFKAYFKGRRQLEIARRALENDEPVGLIYDPNRRTEGLLAEALVGRSSIF